MATHLLCHFVWSPLNSDLFVGTTATKKVVPTMVPPKSGVH